MKVLENLDFFLNFHIGTSIFTSFLSHASVEVQERANIGLQCVLQLRNVCQNKTQSSLTYLFEGNLILRFEKLSTFSLLRRVETGGCKSAKKGADSGRVELG